MATKIIHKKSSTAGSVPAASALEPGELAVNLADRTIYSKTTGGDVIEMGVTDASSILETAKNVSGGTLTAGTPVYQSGTSGNAIEVQQADADTSGMPAIGVLAEDIADQAEGSIVLLGFVNGIDTSSFTAGDTLYISTTGTLTNTPPTGESAKIQNIGKVIKVHASNGSILVTGAGRSNATPNLDDGKFFLGNSSNQATTANFQTEVQTVGDSRYVELSGDTMTGALTTTGLTTSGDILLSKSGETFIYNSVSGTDSLRLGGAAGLKLETYSGSWIDRMNIASNGDISFYEDTGTTAKFFWDASAESLGIGTSSPSTPLHIKDSNGGLVQTIEAGDSSAAYTKYINSTTGNGAFTDGLLVGLDTDESATFWLYEADHMKFATNNTERMRLDSSGNVGIGVTPENSSGTWRNFEQGGMNLVGRSAGGVDGMIGTNYVFKTDNSEVYKTTAATSRIFFDANEFKFQQAASGTAGTAITWSEAMRIDSSGNLLVGVTSSSANMAGLELAANGQLYASTSSSSGHFFNRQSTDGAIVSFRKDGTTVGSIGTTGGDLTIYSSATSHGGIRFAQSGILGTDNSGALSDATRDIGQTDYRWKDLHLSGQARVGTGGRTRLQGAGIYDDSTNGNSVGIFFGGGQYIGPLNGSGNAVDNTVNIGSSSYRFKDLYLSGDINMSGSISNFGSQTDSHLNTSSATTNQYLYWNGSDYAWAAPGAASTEIVNDTTPQLGGDLDLNSNDITGTGNINITGSVKLNSDVEFDTETASTASTTQTTIATFSTSYEAAKYIITAKSGSNITISEMLIAHDGTTAVATEYGTVNTGGSALATYDVDINSGNVRLLATAASATSTTYSVVQTLINA